jgi:DNA primase
VDGKGFVLKPGDGSSQGSHIINGDVLLKNPRYVIIAEGEPDLYTLAQAGFNSVGVPGAGIFKEQWKEHFKMISTIYVALDPDKAGEVGFESILKKLCRPLHRVNMPGCDINSLLQRSGSAEAFSKFFNILLTESEYCEVPL